MSPSSTNPWPAAFATASAWPIRSGSPLTCRLLGFGRDRRAIMTIVGVIGNERVQSDLRAPAEDVAYVPIAQAPRMQVKLAVRTQGDATAVFPAVREAVRQLDDRLALADVRTMEDIWAGSLSGLREPVWLLGIFAAVSALLAALGLYGVLSHSVTQRRREIGIRMALGARANDVVSFVVRGTLSMVGVGLLCGLAGAAALTRVMRTLLFEVSALEPVGVRLRRRGDGHLRTCRRPRPGAARLARRSLDGASQRGLVERISDFYSVVAGSGSNSGPFLRNGPVEIDHTSTR